MRLYRPRQEVLDKTWTFPGSKRPRVDLSTVSAWLGHASITTTNRYLHYLGTSADTAGLERLNRGGGARGVHGDSVETENSLWS